MKLWDFMKDKVGYVVSASLSAILAVSLIWALNPVGGLALAVFTAAIYTLGTAIPLAYEYINKRNFYSNLIRIFDSLDRKNLIAELIESPSFMEGIILYDIIKGSNKAMLEEINKYKFLQEEYREYMELWVHEIKTPIASSRLIAQNNNSDASDSISEELEKIEAFVEQVLFYSRSNTVEKDYLIKEVNLKKLCYDLLKKNSKIFIQSKVGVEAENLDVTVLTDAKWVGFIINQILSNSVKYSDKESGRIRISAEKMENSILLHIEDNGSGIKASELPRIFEKGFTGSNGRKNERSTGMGLYICKKLCDKLGLSIRAYSEYGKGTTVTIIFPKSSMMDIR
jgi:signal transduction histidine kinase